MPTISLTGMRLPGMAALIAAPAALLLTPGRAEAILTYNIFQSGNDVVVQTSGSLVLPPTTGSISCGVDGLLFPSQPLIYTGPDATLNRYNITGPTSFNQGTVDLFADSAGGAISTRLDPFLTTRAFAINGSYAGGPIDSRAVFNGQTLAGLDYTSSGLIGTWDLVDDQNNVVDQINAVVSTAVPGPLPLFGATAA